MKTHQQCELEFTPILPEPKEVSIYARFLKFHHNNPEVYNNLVRLAREFRMGINSNRKMGIAMLFEVLRWNYYLSRLERKSLSCQTISAPHTLA
jgi:hypothetical protein